VLETPAPWEEQTDIHPPLKEWIDEQRGRKKPAEEVKEETQEPTEEEGSCLVQ
jgi:hypothetical protein